MAALVVDMHVAGLAAAARPPPRQGEAWVHDKAALPVEALLVAGFDRPTSISVLAWVQPGEPGVGDDDLDVLREHLAAALQEQGGVDAWKMAAPAEGGLEAARQEAMAGGFTHVIGARLSPAEGASPMRVTLTLWSAADGGTLSEVSSDTWKTTRKAKAAARKAKAAEHARMQPPVCARGRLEARSQVRITTTRNSHGAMTGMEVDEERWLRDANGRVLSPEEMVSVTEGNAELQARAREEVSDAKKRFVLAVSHFALSLAPTPCLCGACILGLGGLAALGTGFANGLGALVVLGAAAVVLAAVPVLAATFLHPLLVGGTYVLGRVLKTTVFREPSNEDLQGMADYHNGRCGT